MASNNTFSSFTHLRDLSVAPGAVFIGPWSGIDHEKFLIVAGVTQDKILVCSVFINSLINPYIQRRPRMLSCQVQLKSADYEFLTHDSYANCAQPIKASYEHFLGDELKYCGLLSEQDVNLVQQSIISSGTLTEDEINLFFKHSE